ncbi:RAP domain-containing protein, putative [Babesia ovata]|uniref:RAP domain-containing protein, putative n=1 Tax=Babesia ovata TaxID=189622 RepID=A0A2H6KDB0_9APIC|nr:RAP domain-containing protein, putative [Babesia ovata]GBE60982.1 RAP domain-containing protein, putative [Babesia ovata]
MRLSRVFRHLCVPEVARLRALVRDGGGDAETLYALFQKHNAQLSPTENLLVAASLRNLSDRQDGSEEISSRLADVRATALANIRGKLYALTDPGDLCGLIQAAVVHGIATRGLISDFSGRLERLLPHVRGEALTQACHTLVELHKAARGSESELTVPNNVALVQCMAETGIRHEALGARVGRSLRLLLAQGGKITTEEASALLQAYKADMFDSLFIRHRLIEAALTGDYIPMQVLVNCLATGVFSPSNANRIDELVREGCSTSDVQTIIQLMIGYGSLRYRPPNVISELVSTVKSALFSLDSFDDVVRCIYGLFLLDEHDPVIMDFAANFIRRYDVPLGLANMEDICDALLAFCHFRLNDPEVYQRLLRDAMRLDCSISSACLIRLQLVAIYIWKLMPQLFHALGEPAQQYLLEVAHRITMEPETARTCDLQESVGKTATFVSHVLYKQVQVGPFLVDFVRELGQEEVAEARQRNCRKPRTRDLGEERLLANHLRPLASILLADDIEQFYRHSHERTAKSQIQLGVLKGLGFRCTCVPHWEWEELDGWREKRAYLAELLAEHKPT